MSADEERPAVEEHVKWYAYCPQGDICSKGDKTLGGFWSEQRARDAVFTHLHCSSYHMLRDMADMADLQEHK